MFWSDFPASVVVVLVFLSAVGAMTMGWMAVRGVRMCLRRLQRRREFLERFVERADAFRFDSWYRRRPQKRVIIMRGIPGAGKTTYARRMFPDARVVSTDAYHVLPMGAPLVFYEGRWYDYGSFLDACGDWRFHDGDPPIFSYKGCYEYAPSLVAEAHDWCFSEFRRLAEQGEKTIVVDNTSITAWELSPYERLGKSYGYHVEIVTLRCPADVAASRNIHGTAMEVVREHAEALERAVLPSHWHHRVLEYPAYESTGEGSHAADRV